MSYNRVVLVGRLTAAPELRYTQSGTAVASFRLAVDRQSQDSQTDFLNIVAWRESGEFAARNLDKGQEILVEGRIQTRNWTDKDGNKRTSVEIIADTFRFVGSKKADQSGGGFTPYEGSDEDQLPF